MSKLIDLTGQRFGRLTVLYRDKETENERINITSFEAIEIDAENTIKKRSFIKGFNLHRNESLILVEKITTSSMINP